MFLLSAGLSTAIAAPQLHPTVLWVPDEYHTGGAYTAIQAAPDGRVYLGSTFYDGFARFLVLPPGGQQFRLIADMATATGERSPGPYAQAKIHTKPAIAPDGKVYFGTKSGKPSENAQWQANYPGGHLLVYNPQSNTVTDLGIPRARQSIISVGIDSQRGLVYILTDPEGHLIVYDPRTLTFVDRGILAHGQRTRYLVVLKNGDVFHPDDNEAFHRYLPATGRIDRVPLRVTGSGSYERPYAMVAATDGATFYGVGNGSGQVYTFIPADQFITVHRHGSIIPEGFRPPATHYAMSAGPDGNIYYSATWSGRDPQRTLFIMRLVPAHNRLESMGEVSSLPALPAGGRSRNTRRPAKHILVQGVTVGPDGTVYVMTAYPLRVLLFPQLAAAR